MKRGRSAFGLIAVLLAFAWVASGVPGAGVSRAAVSTCGSLSLGSGPPVGDKPNGSVLTGVGFVSADESWAVGNRFDAKLFANQTLIERFDGSGWSVIPSPNQGRGNNGLNGVSMVPGGGWAVGYALEPANGLGPQYNPLALRWDGARWSLASPANFTRDTVFTGVDALAK